MPKRLVVYVDIDDTLVRTVGSKRIPIPAVVSHVRQLAEEGAVIFGWSTAGAAYAQATAIELGLGEFFSEYLPKPQVMIDDQAPSDWRSMIVQHPNSVPSEGIAAYSQMLDARAV